MSSAKMQILKHVQKEFIQSKHLQAEIQRLSLALKNKDIALTRKDKELCNMHGVMEDRRKEILELKLALKGSFPPLNARLIFHYLRLFHRSANHDQVETVLQARTTELEALVTNL